MKVSYTKNLRNSTDLRIHSIISILTEAYDYVKLTEAVPYSVAKEYLQIERSPEAESRVKSIFGKLKSLPNAKQLDKRGYRIAFPYAEDSTEFEIQSILEPYDFSIKNYKDGVALDTKSNKEIAIGKALNKISKKEPDAKELIDRYAAIKGKGATNKDEDLMIIFSSAKYDIIGMSTGREWDSCMNVIEGGGNKSYVKIDLKEGSIICYLTTVSDTDLKKPLGRILIKPYINTKNREDVVLYAELRTYGKIPNPEKFIDEVDDYMEKTQKLSGSYKRLGCLYRDSDRSEIEGKETIRTRALKKLKDAKLLTRAEFVSLPLKNKRQYIDRLIKKEYSLQRYEYNFASQSQKKEYIRKILYNWQDVKDYEFKGAPKDIKSEIISKKLKYKNPLEQYEFEAATQEQKEEYIDFKLSKKSIIYREEFEAATPKQKEEYIDWALLEYPLDNYEFEAATKKQKEKYIDIRIKNGDSLKRNVFELATTEQKEEYIDWKILMEENLDEYVIEAATDNQQKDYVIMIFKNFSLTYFEMFGSTHFRYFKEKAKEKYIDLLLDTKRQLGSIEFKAATPEQKERYKEYAKD